MRRVKIAPAQPAAIARVNATTLKPIERDLQSRQRVDEELRRMTRLHELSAQVVGPGDVHAMLDSVLRAAVDITAATMGNIQRCDEAATLTTAAHVGFDRPFLDFFAHVDSHTDCAGGAAEATRQRVCIDDVTTSRIFGGHRSLDVMTAAGVRAMQSTPLFDRSHQLLGVFSTYYREVHHFDEAELRWLDLLAHHAVDVIERQRADDLLARSHQELEARVAYQTRWLSLMHDLMMEINEATTWDEALHQLLRRLCETEHWQIGFVYLPQPGNPETIAPVVSCYDDERFRPFHELSMQQTYARGHSLPGQVWVENTQFWALDTEELFVAAPLRAAVAATAGLRAGAAFPVSVQSEVVAVMELFSDQAHPPARPLTSLMQSVSDQIGRVLERERATARMADLISHERQGLLNTLHDSLGQTLTALGMLSAGLRRRLLATDTETAETAAEIARQTQLALDQVRLLTKNLFPIDMDAESLLAALRDLVSATMSLHQIDGHVEGELPKAMDVGKFATELYRIAQEAVTNSVRHARAKTITIRLEGGSELIRLVIADDGIGIPTSAPRDGAGLRIMRYRATSIGASVTVERGTRGGTVVTCTLRQPPSSRKARA